MIREPFAWRGIEFEWSRGQDGYVAHTSEGRWVIQKHANNDAEWYARFNNYTGHWKPTREEALQSVVTETLIACARIVDFLHSLGPL